MKYFDEDDTLRQFDIDAIKNAHILKMTSKEFSCNLGGDDFLAQARRLGSRQLQTLLARLGV